MKICVSYDRNPVRVVPSIPKKGRVRPALTIHPPYDTPLFEGKSKKEEPEALTLTLQEQISGNNPVSPDSTSASTVVHPQARPSCMRIFTWFQDGMAISPIREWCTQGDLWQEELSTGRRRPYSLHLDRSL